MRRSFPLLSAWFRFFISLSMTLALDTKSPLALLSQTLDQACCLDPSSAGFALGLRAALGGLSREAGLLSDAQREGALVCYRRPFLVATPLRLYALAPLDRPGRDAA